MERETPTPNCAMTSFDGRGQTSGRRNIPGHASGEATGLRTACMAVTALFIAAMCAGCTSGPRFFGRIEIQSSPEISVVRAVAHYRASGIVVDGDVRRPNGYAGVVPGYLHVEGRDASGTIIATTQTKWGEFKSRRFRLAYFRAFLAASAPSAIASVAIEPETGAAN